MVTNSCTPIAPAAAARPRSHQPPSQSSPRSSGRPAAATSRRDSRLLTPGGTPSPSTEAPAPASVLLERRPQLLRAEIGPKGVGEDVLGVGRLPEQEVRDPPRRVDELGAAAVVERDPELQRRLAGGGRLQRLHLLAQPGGRAVATADEA